MNDGGVKQSVKQTARKKNGGTLRHRRSANVRSGGAGDGIRTRDSLLGKQELYH